MEKMELQHALTAYLAQIDCCIKFSSQIYVWVMYDWLMYNAIDYLFTPFHIILKVLVD